MQLTVRLNCPISMGFIKQFYQLDKVTSQKVSPLTIALGRKKAERVEDFYREDIFGFATEPAVPS